MSNRTSLADRAIKQAWIREQELVRKGMGTRDWTPAQQRDILKTGKAHDAAGKAFEGHHMKWVSGYPDFQGCIDNIQFLSRAEHLDAHGGKTQNPTNGYYDYIQRKTTVTFDEDTLIPIVPKPLTELADEVKEIMANESKPLQEGADPPKETPGTGDKTVPIEKDSGDRVQPEVSISGGSEPSQNAESNPSGDNPAPDNKSKNEATNESHESRGRTEGSQNTDHRKRQIVTPSQPRARPTKRPETRLGFFERVRRLKRRYDDWRDSNDYWIEPVERIGSFLVRDVAVPLLGEKIAGDMEARHEAALEERHRHDSENAARCDRSSDDDSTRTDPSFDDANPSAPIPDDTVIPDTTTQGDDTGRGSPKSPHPRIGYEGLRRKRNKDGELEWTKVPVKPTFIHPDQIDTDDEEDKNEDD